MKAILAPKRCLNASGFDAKLHLITEWRTYLIGMSLLALCLCIIILIGSAAGSDIPFVFGKGASGIADYTSAQIEQASIASPDLTGVPPLTSAADNATLPFPVVGGGSNPQGITEKKVAELRKMFDLRVEPENPTVHDTAVDITVAYPGESTVDQVSAIFSYLISGDNQKKGWRYVAGPRGVNDFFFANETLKRGERANCVGVGDCGDFAILMSALVESIGGTTRIILASNNTTGGHAYAQVYIGQDNIQNSETEEIIKQLKQEFDTDKIFTNIDTNTRDVWLNLDWWPDQAGNPHPGGPFFTGDKNIVLYVRENYPTHPLKLPDKINKPPKLIKLSPDKTSPRDAGTVVVWAAEAKDPDKDQILYRFFLNDNSVTKWITDNKWVWNTTNEDVGENQIGVQVRDGKYGHELPNGFDDSKSSSFNVTETNSEIDWIKKGNDLNKLGKYPDAIQAYDKAIELNPLSFEAWSDRGNAFYNLGKYDEAIQAYDKALKIYPNYDKAKSGKQSAEYAQYEASKPKGVPAQETNNNWIPGYHWPGSG